MTDQYIIPATQADLEKLLTDSRINNTNKDGTKSTFAIRSHAAKGPIFIHFPLDTYIVLDFKDAGYPNKGYANTACGIGGNYTFANQPYPEDLFKKERKEEVAQHFNSLGRFEAFGEYFGVYPSEAHGNPKIGLYLNPVSWFVTHMNGYAAADALKIAREDIKLEAFQKAVPPIMDFKGATVLSLNEIRNGKLADGSVKFSWGDERLLRETISTLYDFDPHIPMDNRSTMYRQLDIRLNQSFASRWSIKHDYTSDGGTKETADPHVFAGGVATQQPKK